MRRSSTSHTIKPIDTACVTEYAQKCGKVVTVEEHSVIGGLGDAVAEVPDGQGQLQVQEDRRK